MPFQLAMCRGNCSRERECKEQLTCRCVALRMPHVEPRSAATQDESNVSGIRAV